jgi:hypothetical protein
MKNQKFQSDKTVNHLDETVDLNQKKDHFSEKKAKNKILRADLIDDDRQEPKPKMKFIKGAEQLEDAWDDDDEALFEWRRKGKVGSLANSDSTEKS